MLPALHEVGGSFWRSLSSFKIRFEAMDRVRGSCLFYRAVEREKTRKSSRQREGGLDDEDIGQNELIKQIKYGEAEKEP